MGRYETVGVVCDTVETGGFDIAETRFATPARTPWHSHDTACLTVVLDGVYAEEATGLAHTQEQGTLLFKCAGESHRNRFAQPARTLLIQFDPTSSEAELLRAPFLGECFSLRSPEVADLGAALSLDLASGAASGASLQCWVHELLGLAAMSRAPTRPVIDGRVAAGAREWLHANFQAPLDLKSIATSMDVSITHVARAFRRAFGCTMGAYQRHLRVGWAFRALRHGGKALAHIAHEAGFFDQSHMNRVFRLQARLTPGEVRAARHGRGAS